MTKDEMRFLRRELINIYLHIAFSMDEPVLLSELKETVRELERANHGSELKAYA
jgi:hypothetical protein